MLRLLIGVIRSTSAPFSERRNSARAPALESRGNKSLILSVMHWSPFGTFSCDCYFTFEGCAFTQQLSDVHLTTSHGIWEKFKSKTNLESNANFCGSFIGKTGTWSYIAYHTLNFLKIIFTYSCATESQLPVTISNHFLSLSYKNSLGSSLVV